MSNYRRWWEQAVCATIPDFLNQLAPQQKEACAACPVTVECLREALELEEAGTVRMGWDVRGGLDGEERRQILSEAAKKRPVRRHGTRSGYFRHRYLGEKPCEPCTAANREYNNRWYQRNVAS